MGDGDFIVFIKGKNGSFPPSDGTSNAPAILRKRHIYKAFRDKMKRTGNRHIVSITGPVLVRKRRLELPRRLTHAPQTCLSTCSSTLAYHAYAVSAFKVSMASLGARRI